jgi:hypothetical protein
MAREKGKGGKDDACWNCGARLDRPYNGTPPEPHGCGKGGCVRCPKCGSGICEYDPEAKGSSSGGKGGSGGKGSKKERMKGMVREQAKPSGGSGGSGGKGGDPVDPRDYLGAVDPFPLHVFPAPIQTYIKETVAAFGCPADFVGLAVLVNAAAAIGNTRRVQLKEDYRAPAGLYGGIIGDPGLTKTPVLSHVSAPLDRRQADLLQQFRRDWARYQRNKEAATQRARKAKGAKVKSPMTDPSADLAAVLENYDCEKPTLQRIVSSDTTVEALCTILAENPRGLLLKRDELVAWVRGMDMYRKGKGTDRQFFMSAYSCAPFVLDRKSNTDRLPVIVPLPYLCVIGCLTPDMLPEFADEQGREDGFVDRILWVFPDAHGAADWTEAGVSAEAKQAWEDCLRSLWSLEPIEDRNQYVPKSVRLQDGARRAWIAFYNAITRETALPDFPRNLVGPWRKLRDYGARLSLIMHEMRVACEECRDEDLVGEESILAAAELIDYFKSQAARVHAAMLAKPTLSEADMAVVESVDKLVPPDKPCWSGNSSKLLNDLTPLAGNAVNLPRWPQSPETMGHAIRRVAGHLATSRGITVTIPPTSDKTRTITIARQPPKPPKPPGGDGSGSGSITCDSDDSGRSENRTAQTAQEEMEDGAI